MQKNSRSFFGGTGFYITLAVCLVAAGLLGYRLFLPENDLKAEEPVLETRDTPKAEVSSPTPIIIEDQEDEETPDAPAASVSGSETAETGDKIVSPLVGQTIAAFSSDALTYNAALADWRTHNGVDIAAEEGTTVCASCAGTVKAVEDDPLMGTTVVIAHTGGYTSTYANLGVEVSVETGDEVAAGESIGTVGTTAAAEGGTAHLHFSVSRDGELIDPEDYLSLAK